MQIDFTKLASTEKQAGIGAALFKGLGSAARRGIKSPIMQRGLRDLMNPYTWLGLSGLGGAGLAIPALREYLDSRKPKFGSMPLAYSHPGGFAKPRTTVGGTHTPPPPPSPMTLELRGRGRR